MNNTAAVFLVALLSLSVACGDPAPSPVDASSSCSDEYYSGTVRFPDGSMREVCSPASSEGLVVQYTPLSGCAFGVMGANGSSAGGDASWSVRTGWFPTDPMYDGDWFTSPGALKLSVRYEPVAAPPSQCRPGLPLDCGAFGTGCDFELTRAAGANGDEVEANLTAPCEMRSSNYDDPWRPTLTAFRFRTHLSGFAPPDAGSCVPFP